MDLPSGVDTSAPCLEGLKPKVLTSEDPERDLEGCEHVEVTGDGLELGEVHFCVPPPWPWPEELEELEEPHGEQGDETPPPPYLAYELPPPPPPPMACEHELDSGGHCMAILAGGAGIPLPPDPPPAVVLGRIVDIAGCYPATHGSEPAPPCAPSDGFDRCRLDSGETAPVLSVIPAAALPPEPPPDPSFVVHARSDRPTPALVFARKGRTASFAMELDTEGREADWIKGLQVTC